MKISPLLLCALLAVPVCAVAAPAAKPVAPNAKPAAPAAPTHDEGDGHEHGGGPKINEGSLTDYLWRRSDAAFHAGDYPRAIELHRAIVAVDPTDVESYSVGAWLLWSTEKSDEANAFIAQGLKHNPENSEMWDAAGAQYGLEKRFAQERDAYGKAVELAGKDADMMLRRRYAHASEHAGDLQTSEQIWRDLARDFPKDAVNKNNLARVEEQLAAQGATQNATQNADGAVKAMGFVGLGALGLLGCSAWKKRVGHSGTI